MKKTDKQLSTGSTQYHFSIRAQKNGAGFTILELLVVIAIIGILTTLTLTLLSGVRERSRDSRRIEDIKSIETALHLYATDNDGTFPSTSDFEIINGSTDTLSVALLSNDSISIIPLDPQNSGGINVYQYDSDGNGYALSFCLEGNTIPGYAQGCGNTITQ